jgi:mannose-6-phosphate isomerase-like protein (cupin superfamily)
MRKRNVIASILITSLCSFVARGQRASEPPSGTDAASLILEKPEGERRLHRSAGTTIGTAPFILKFDPKNGGTKHLVLFSENLLAGAAIPRHKHPSCEEILILETGKTRVHLGETVTEVGPGATVFIPQDTWFSAEVIGSEPVSLVAIFSEPGFEDYMRAISVREEEPRTPMSKAELDAVRLQHLHAVTYK